MFQKRFEIMIGWRNGSGKSKAYGEKSAKYSTLLHMTAKRCMALLKIWHWMKCSSLSTGNAGSEYRCQKHLENGFYIYCSLIRIILWKCFQENKHGVTEMVNYLNGQLAFVIQFECFPHIFNENWQSRNEGWMWSFSDLEILNFTLRNSVVQTTVEK